MEATLKIGGYSIEMAYDDKTNLYSGSLVDLPIAVRLSTPTAERLRKRFEWMLADYLGLMPSRRPVFTVPTHSIRQSA